MSNIKNFFLQRKKNVLKIFNKIYNHEENINTQILYHLDYNPEEKIIEKILFFNNGNILLRTEKSFSIRNGKTYQKINEHTINFYNDEMLDEMVLSDYEILFISAKKEKCFYFLYLKFDKKYNIIDSFYKNYKIFSRYFEGGEVKTFTGLKLNKKNTFVMISHFFSPYNDKSIYFFNINKKNKDIILTTKINVYLSFLLEVKSKNEYIIYCNYYNITILNANNFLLKKSVSFDINRFAEYSNKTLFVLNDKYILFLCLDEDDKSIILYNLTDFKQISKYKLKIDLYNILYIEKNIFFSQSESFIKKYKYDENKNEIICLGNIKLKHCFVNVNFGKINNEYYLFYHGFCSYFEIQKIEDQEEK